MRVPGPGGPDPAPAHPQPGAPGPQSPPGQPLPPDDHVRRPHRALPGRGAGRARHYPRLFLETIIPRTVRLGEAPSYGQSILRYDPAGRGRRLPGPGGRGGRAHLQGAPECRRAGQRAEGASAGAWTPHRAPAGDPGIAPLGADSGPPEAPPRSATAPAPDGAPWRWSWGGSSPTPRQPRRQMDEASWGELADSIREHGVLQPLVVTPSSERRRGASALSPGGRGAPLAGGEDRRPGGPRWWCATSPPASCWSWLWWRTSSGRTSTPGDGHRLPPAGGGVRADPGADRAPGGKSASPWPTPCACCTSPRGAAGPPGGAAQRGPRPGHPGPRGRGGPAPGGAAGGRGGLSVRQTEELVRACSTPSPPGPARAPGGRRGLELEDRFRAAPWGRRSASGTRRGGA